MNKLKFYGIVLNGLLSQAIIAQQSIDKYITDSSKNSFVLIANSTNNLVSPIDLDFHPNQIQRPNELWILNQGTNNTGGSTEIIFNPSKSTRTYKYIKDGNAWHFMALASAMAFGDSNWATTQDILDANRQGGKYTGATLWPGDLSIYGIVGNPSTPQINGSHLSMIHQTPYGKGIAFEKNNIYWVMDGYEGNIKRYDFGNPHQPGGEDHSGGGVRVFPEFSFTRHTTLPAHIVIDENRKYLYGSDPVGKRIFRIDITSGTSTGPRTLVNSESLGLGYFGYSGLVKKDTIIKGLVNPVGIDVYGSRLIVTDNGTDEIIIFDISNNYKEIGRIKLKYVTNPDPMGIKVGPDGKIYFVDKTNRRAYMIDNSSVYPLSIKESLNAQNVFSVYPNPSTNTVNIQFNANINNSEITIVNLLGKSVTSPITTTLKNNTIDISLLTNGVYFVQVKTNNQIFTQKLIKQ